MHCMISLPRWHSNVTNGHTACSSEGLQNEDMAAVSITLQAGSNPPGVRFMLQQYHERCKSEIVALRTKHAGLVAKGVALPASQREQEQAAAAACVETNMVALRVLLRLEAAPAGVLPARLLPVEESASDTSLSLYDDLEQVLLHVARDWSDEAATLNADRYRIVRAVAHLVPPVVEHGAPRRRILVLGSGLGRMAFELCKRGYDIDAVDASLAMTLAAATMSDWAATKPNPPTLRCHPWFLRSANLRDTAARFQKVVAPGKEAPLPTAPAPAPAPAPQPQPSWIAGECNLDTVCKTTLHRESHFTSPQLHFSHGRFPGPAEMPEAQTHDCVVSHFFIDAVLEDLTIVVDAVARALKTGGIWHCLGPLKWQQAPGRPASSFYSWNEVLLVVAAAGFELMTTVRA